MFALAQPAAAQIPCSYEVSAIIQAPPCGTLDSLTVGKAISPNGRWVVGYHSCPLGGFRAFVFDSSSSAFTTIHPPGFFTSHANDVNDAGIVVGFMGGSSGDFGFVYDAVTGQFLHTLASDSPGGVCEATGINSSNVVCGFRAITGAPNYLSTAFRWSAAEGFTDLGLIDGQGTVAHDMNESGEIVVADAWILGTIAGRWDGKQFEHLPPLPDGSVPYPRKINNLGEVGGTALLGTSTSQPFVWARDDLILLGTLPGANRGGVGGMNDRGEVTGLNTMTTGGQRAYVWRDGVMGDLTALVNQPGLVFTRAMGISEDGLIIAEAGGVAAVVLAPVQPAPGDTNCDGIINVTDLLSVIRHWGICNGCVQDFTGDGNVDHSDLLVVIVNWG